MATSLLQHTESKSEPRLSFLSVPFSFSLCIPHHSAEPSRACSGAVCSARPPYVPAAGTGAHLCDRFVVLTCSLLLCSSPFCTGCCFTSSSSPLSYFLHVLFSLSVLEYTKSFTWEIFPCLERFSESMLSMGLFPEMSHFPLLLFLC